MKTFISITLCFIWLSATGQNDTADNVKNTDGLYLDIGGGINVPSYNFSPVVTNFPNYGININLDFEFKINKSAYLLSMNYYTISTKVYYDITEGALWEQSYLAFKIKYNYFFVDWAYLSGNLSYNSLSNSTYDGDWDFDEVGNFIGIGLGGGFEIIRYIRLDFTFDYALSDINTRYDAFGGASVMPLITTVSLIFRIPLFSL